jgi:FkbM family methyltransferase
MAQDSLRARSIRAAARWLKPLQLARFPLVRQLYRAAYRSAVPPGQTVEVALRGQRFFVDPHDGGVGYQLYIGRGYEELTAQLFERAITPGMTVLDLGANIGFYTLLAAPRVLPGGRVFAFEPAPENVELLRKNVAANGLEHVTVVPKACSDSAGRVTLHLSPRGKGLHTIGAAGNGWASLEIETVRLDEFFDDPRFIVDVAKIDIEGAETRALRGMERLIARSPRMKLLTEINPTALAQNGDTAESYLRALFAHGFKIESAVDEAASRVLTPSLDELMRMCERRPTEVKHWNCNVLMSR